jgi:methyl-accepting chemotaxis protein
MLHRLKIASKLLIGFGALLLLLVGGFSFWTYSSVASKSTIENLARFKANEVQQERFQKAVQTGRMHIWMALGSGDQAHWQEADAAFKAASEHLDDLTKDTVDPPRRAQAQQMVSLLQNFRGVLDKFRAFGGKNQALDTPEAKAIFADALKAGATISTVGETLAKDYSDAAQKVEGEAKESADFAIALAIGAGVTSLLIGLGLAAVTARSIKNPIISLTNAVGSLARGDLSVAIPYAEDPNEVGEMARSVAVFKDNALERQRLEAEAAENRAAAEAERERRAAEQARIAAEQAEAVRRLGAALKNLAAGDLTVRLSDGFAEAYAQIRDDFNDSIDKLKETMLAVVSSTGAIESGTREISTASDDLSKRTEQQAASLEETAAALDEITATVKKSAEGASHARAVAAAADEDAKKSAVVVREAVEAMQTIAKSSTQISQIIGVIDEIAFQTNLLALNAGVEAARAGEAGRGFAVVASEVRALAQRSAEAAKEIKGLISASTSQVDHGVRLVAETGASLERIMAQVGEVNGIVAQIAAGAQEQATGLQQVNTAINQMDQVTQQNAAMVQESTAASHSLSKETSQLSGLVGQFQVGGVADGALRRELQKVAAHAFPQPAKTPQATAATLERPARPKRAAAGGAARGGDAGWEEF